MMSSTLAAAAPSTDYGVANLFRAVGLRSARALTRGVLRVHDRAGQFTFGSPDADGLSATVNVRRDRFWQRLVLGGSLGAADAYADGDWSADDLVAAIRLFVRNEQAMSKLDGGGARLGRVAALARNVLNRNTREESRRNIAAHYDLGDALFRRMLDPTMTYSCGLFERQGATLEEASLAKIDRLLDALELAPHHHLLEIGSGWGALAVRAAETRGCRVSTTTVSEAQFAAVSRLVQERGLAARVEVLRADYRDLRGVFDRIVSVEMIEAIGAAQYGAFFAACERLVGAAGVVAVQAITLPDSVFDAARRDVDFVRARVFPGSEIPSVTALLAAAARASSLRPHSLVEIGPHYVPTLAAWRANLMAARDDVVAARGVGFFRTFEYYLSYCEAGFAERYLGDVQLVLRGPAARLERGGPR